MDDIDAWRQLRDEGRANRQRREQLAIVRRCVDGPHARAGADAELLRERRSRVTNEAGRHDLATLTFCQPAGEFLRRARRLMRSSVIGKGRGMRIEALAVAALALSGGTAAAQLFTEVTATHLPPRTEG